MWTLNDTTHGRKYLGTKMYPQEPRPWLSHQILDKVLLEGLEIKIANQWNLK